MQNLIRPWLKQIISNKAQKNTNKITKIEPDERPAIKIPEYTHNKEKRNAVLSTVTTHTHDASNAVLKNISELMHLDKFEIGNIKFNLQYCYIPEGKTLSVSGVRKELEIAGDKLQLMICAPDIVVQMLEYAVNDYKQLLRDSLSIIKSAAKAYALDIIKSGEISKDEARLLITDQGQAALVLLEGFNEFFDDFVTTNKKLHALYNKQHKLWVKSAFNIANIGTLNIDNNELSTRNIAKCFNVKSPNNSASSKIDLHLILHDVGFRYYIGGLGGKHVYYWDWVRNTAQKLGLYKGQF